MKDINHEIEVVENIIEILKKCLALHIREKQPKQIAAAKKDIQICKKELSRLIEARADAKEKEQDAATK